MVVLMVVEEEEVGVVAEAVVGEVGVQGEPTG